jgi:hypothetical protein
MSKVTKTPVLIEKFNAEYDMVTDLLREKMFIDSQRPVETLPASTIHKDQEVRKKNTK